MKHRAVLACSLAAAALLTGCGTHRDRTPAETTRHDSVADDARELVSDAVRDGKELASDAVQNGREMASDAVQNGREMASDAADKGREIVSDAARDVSDAMDKTDSDGEYRTDSEGRVKPDDVSGRSR